MHRRLLLLGLLLLLIASCDRSQDTPSTSVPAGRFPAQEGRLANGLRVLTLSDRSTPIVAVQVWYHVGAVDEPARQNGFAHLFEHMMFRGTDRLDATGHMDLIRSVGGECNAYTSFDQTVYVQKVPSRQLDLVLWLEAERMAFLNIDPEGFAKERKVVEEERRMGLNQPYGDLLELALPAIFGDHPYRHTIIGSSDDLRKASTTDVHAWWNTWYVPRNATLVVVGDCDHLQVMQAAEQAFGWIPSGGELPAPRPAVVGPAMAFSTDLKLANAPAPGVALLWRTVPESHADHLLLEMAGTVLGGGASSRLYRRLVADRNLAAHALAMQASLERAGIFAAGAILPPTGGDLDPVQKILAEEVARLVAEGITAEECEKARNQYLNGLVMGAQTVEGKANLIGSAAVVGAGVDELDGRVARLRTVQATQIQAAATRHLTPDKAITLRIPGNSLLGNLGLLFGGKKQDTGKDAEAPPVTGPALRGRPGVVRPASVSTTPPIDANDRPVPIPQVETLILTNGLRVLFSPNHETPAISMVMTFPQGDWAIAKPGVASMTMQLLTKGTKTLDEKALAEALDRHGISISGSAGEDHLTVSASFLSDHADRAFALLASILREPTFPEQPLKTAILQASTGLVMADRAPGQVAGRELDRHLFPGHPYGRRLSGEMNDLGMIRRQDLADFWGQAGQVREAVLVIAGDLTLAQARHLAQCHLGGWDTSDSRPPSQTQSLPPLPELMDPTRIFLVDWPGAEQSEIRIGSRIPLPISSPDEPVAKLVSSYLGGSFGSRLMKAIRIDAGSTYGAWGAFGSQRFAGTFQAGTFTKTAGTVDTLRLVLTEIRKAATTPPTTEELSLHRRYFIGSSVARFETPAQVAGHLAFGELLGLPRDRLARTCTAIAATPAEACTGFAQRVLDPDRLVIVVVADASQVKSGLESIAPVTVLDATGAEKRP